MRTSCAGFVPNSYRAAECGQAAARVVYFEVWLESC
jgi:hypothetical protein